MRDAFVAELLGLAREESRIMLLTGDLGFGVLVGFSEELPRQFLNAGVAEQNMTGLAAGLALAGRTVFTYSIANFPTLRCLEQIRNDIAYHDADVKIVAIGGGFSYGSLGMSHHATEDLAILRALPNVDIHVPCDETETRALTRILARNGRPAYFRLDKSKVAGTEGLPFEAGRLRCLAEGRDVAILCCGGIATEALGARDRLVAQGISCSVYSAHTLRPFDTEGLKAIAEAHDAVVTLEEHVIQGGLGALVAEVFMDSGTRPGRFLRLALPDAYSAIVGSQEYLRAQWGLDAPAIAARVARLVGRST